MEEFDQVDMDDNVIGTTNKPTAHLSRHIHRVAAVYVFNSEGDLYMQVHKVSNGLFDNSVGGHVSKGESYLQAAEREAFEELGLSQKLARVSTFYSDEGEYLHMFGLFECIADANWKFTPNHEVDEIVPMSVSDIRKLMKKSPEKFTGGFINTMNEYIRIKRL